MPEDEEEIEDTEQILEEEETTEPEPPKKWAGKYANEDELEKAYLAEQAKLTQLAQENAELRKAQTTGQPVQQNAAPADYQEQNDPWADAFDSTENLGKRVQETVYGAIGQFSNIMRNADANIENILLERESDPLYKEVGRAFRAELRRVEPHVMADLNQAPQVAEMVYNAVCGRHARTVLTRTRENPTDRMEHLKALGVESPQPNEDTNVEAVTRGELEMLRGLGLTKKSREDVIRRVAAQAEEED